jgi:hypothetical protein
MRWLMDTYDYSSSSSSTSGDWDYVDECAKKFSRNNHRIMTFPKTVISCPLQTKTTRSVSTQTPIVLHVNNGTQTMEFFERDDTEAEKEEPDSCLPTSNRTTQVVISMLGAGCMTLLGWFTMFVSDENLRLPHVDLSKI